MDEIVSVNLEVMTAITIPLDVRRSLDESLSVVTTTAVDLDFTRTVNVTVDL